ncbi:CHAT domain-containing protein [Aspergillus stella-maris]|uniref:CHAT domain-containing protein n=1 Tax=Aspergillus stella-maris TaxID=1810926 RepID=UPI003CCE0DB1
MAGLEEDIRVAREALLAIPEDHPDRAMYLNNLGYLLGDQYSRTGAMAALEESIQLGREVVKIIPEDRPNRAIHSNHAMYLNNLGIRLGDQYSRTSTMAALLKKDHPDHAMYLNNLGSRLGDQYSRTGAMTTLEESIQIGWKAIKAIPEDHPDHVIYLDNLGICLGAQYIRTGKMTTLEESIQLGREVIKTTPEDHPNRAGRAMAALEESIQLDHPDRAVYLNNLGCRLGDQYSRTGTMATLEDTIPEDHPNRAMTGAMAALEESIQLGQEVIKITPEDRPDRAKYLNNLGNRFKDQYSRTGAIADLEKAILYAKSVLQQETSFISAWIKDWQDCDKVAEITISLQHLLAHVVGLASNAAAAVLNTHRGAYAVLSLLEMGCDLYNFQDAYPLMAQRLMQLRDPGFDDFLQAPSDKKMYHAAQKGPIVIINISQYHCNAILVKQDWIHTLPLPNLSSNKIKEKAKGNNLGSPEVLEWLWNCIMDPVLEKLGFTQSPSDTNWPHVWWIPTGSLTKFPLHATGYHGRGDSRTVLDWVMLSYSLLVKAIIHGRKRPVQQSSSLQALLVAMEHTPGNYHLLFAAKEVEMLQGRCREMGLYSTQPKPYRQDIISHLKNCRIFYFAGHGYTDHANPSKSQLILEDGQGDLLAVADLLEMNLRKYSPFLAYLSACGTGQIKDERFLDESIHLISAFQLAGFRHVIGTLWSVNDETCVDMARIIYRELGNKQVDDQAVCQGLHQAAREMRDCWIHASPAMRYLPKPLGGTAGLPRDIISTETDTDGEKCRTQAFWVPYVHFGV